MTVAPGGLSFNVVVIAAALFGVSSLGESNLKYLDPSSLQTKSNSTEQEAAALNVIQKYLKNVAVRVTLPLLHKYKKDAFVLRTKDNRLYIEASSGVAAVWGFHYFLKKYCKSYVGWQTSHVNIPQPLPAVSRRVVAADRFRYYQNAVTFSYSFVWWNVSQWEQHVEWMALNGINLAPAPVDEERLWINIYKKFGLKNNEIEQHFTGPAFLSWLRLGAINGWRGGLPASWHRRAAAVRHTVNTLMLQLGIVPVLPAFNGHVPKSFQRLFPNASYHKVSRWRNFPQDFCCGVFLDGRDPLFSVIGKKFLTAVTDVTGKNNFYSADPFYEVTIGEMTDDIIQSAAKAIFNTMVEVDDRAVWVMHSWMLSSYPEVWVRSATRALLRAPPRGRLLLLDTQAERHPQHITRKHFYGQPFIWCLMQNYGGQLDMIGNLHTINTAPIYTRTKRKSTMVGIGITPEGINQNYVVYDLMLELGWRKQPVDLYRWVKKYGIRRYGCNSTGSAWASLVNSVYNYSDSKHEYYYYYLHPYNSNPSLDYPKTTWYAGEHIFEALEQMLRGRRDCHTDGYLLDLVSVTAQALQLRAAELLPSLRAAAIESRNISALRTVSRKYLNVLQDIEAILATHEYFSISGWLDGARSFAKTNRERRHYEINALTQITLWGPNGELSDYAAKKWAELFQHYYIPRWRLLLRELIAAKQERRPFHEQPVQNYIREYLEKYFIMMTDLTKPQKLDTLSLAIYLCYKWKGDSDHSVTFISR